jgi:hypothetical protein
MRKIWMKTCAKDEKVSKSEEKEQRIRRTGNDEKEMERRVHERIMRSERGRVYTRVQR